VVGPVDHRLRRVPGLLAVDEVHAVVDEELLAGDAALLDLVVLVAARDGEHVVARVVERVRSNACAVGNRL
jgi:hypothetical protein